MKNDKWIMVRKTWRGDGSRTIRYECGNVAIESRKIAIPHAGGRGGFWNYTSYWLILPDGTEREYNTMRDAKAAGEAALEEDTHERP